MCWRECEGKGKSLALFMGYKLMQPLWRTVWISFRKLGIKITYDIEIPLLGINLEKTVIEKDIYTPMFIAALFTIIRTWIKLNCPLTEERIKKLWYSVQFSSVQSLSVSNTLQAHGLQHTRPPCPSPTPKVYSNSYPLSR